MESSKNIGQYLSRGISWTAVIFFFLLPLYVLPFTTEFSEYNKLYLLIFGSFVLLVLWLVRSLIQKKVVISKTPFDIAFVLLLASFAFSTFYSVSMTNSLFGTFNSWHWTIVELCALVAFFYVIVTSVRQIATVRLMVFAFMTSSFIVALVAILGYFNVFDTVFNDTTNLFLSSLTIDGFSLAGSVDSTIILFLVSLFFTIPLALRALKDKKIFSVATYGLMSGAIAFALVLWLGHYIPGVPAHGSSPAQLSFSTSWRVASSAIRDYPWFGTGLSSFSAAYNAYRPAAINQTEFWSVIFDRSGSEYMTLLTTTGVIGLVAFLFFVVRAMFAARTSLTSSVSLKVESFMTHTKNASILGVISIVFLYFFTSSTVSTSILLFMLLVLWMLTEKLTQPEGGMVDEVELSFAAIRGDKDRQGEPSQLLPWIVGVPLLIIASVVMFFTVQDVRSNFAYASSLRMIGQNATPVDIYNQQTAAINLNGRRDAYHRSFADTNISFANLIAQSQGETLTDTDRNDIVTLIDEAIRQVRIITEILDPASASNWQVRANVYRNLLGVATGADQWSLQAYQNAISLAPNDPRLYVDLGGLYLTLAVSTSDEGTTGEAPGDDVPTTPTTKQDNLARSEAALLKAISLKSDYANAHYNLAAVYNAAERYDLAKSELETTLRLIDPASPSYEQAQKDLETISAQIEPTPTPTPLAQ